MKLNEEDDDDKKKRRKRQIFDTSESDSSDSLIGNTASLFGLNPSFDSSQSGSDGYPQASAFQEMLTRTQFNDRLAELPRAVGVQSPQQLAGSGLSGANLQKGGLATVSPLYSQSTEHSNTDSSDKDLLHSDTHSFLTNGANLGFQLNNDRHNIDTKTPDSFNTGVLNHGQLFNHQPNPTEASSLIDSVREQAEKLGLGDHLPSPNPTEMLETIKDHISEHGVMPNTDNSETKPHDMMGLLNSQLSDIIQNRGQDNSDSKSHDILNIDNPSLSNVNPTEQSRENLGFGHQDILSAYNKNNPDFISNGIAPTTVSPLLDALIGQDAQNSDDSSVLSDTVKDLLQGVTNSDTNQKDLSDSAKDMLQTLQPEMPSHSETIESLADKLININDASITTPATSIFNGNQQITDNFEAGSTNNFPNIDRDLGLQNTGDQSNDVKTEILSSDDKSKDYEAPSDFTGEVNPFSSDDSSKVEPPSPLEIDKKISDILGNDDLKTEEANVNGENIGITEKGPILADTVNSLPEISDEKILDTESLNINSGLDDIPELFGSIDKTDDKSLTADLPKEKTVLTKLEIDEDDKDKTESLQPSLPSEMEATSNQFSISDLTQNDTDLNDDITSKVIDTVKDDEHTFNDFVGIAEEDNSKVTSLPDDETGKLSLSSDDSESQKTITDNLKNYLSVTKPDGDDNTETADQLQKNLGEENIEADLIQNDDTVKIATDEIDNSEKKEIELENQPTLKKEKDLLADEILPESINEDEVKASIMEDKDGNTELLDDIAKIDDSVTSVKEVTTELTDELQDDMITEDNNVESSDINPKDKFELDQQSPIDKGIEDDLDDSEKRIADTLDNTEDTENKMSDNIDDPIETLLKEFKRNTTQNEIDDDTSFKVGTDVDDLDIEHTERDDLNRDN
ncbi:MAG: hypothetical protein AB2693_28225, partial [Candidatus Thiodiazotropha sp.]